MSDPNSAIPAHATPQLWRRYESYRAQRYERSLIRNAGRWPAIRNQRSYRRVVMAMMGFLTVFMASAVVAFFSPAWFLIPFLVGLAGFSSTLAVLKVITGNIADAPVSALDEIQLAQRNSARSIGYIVLFALMFIPYLTLIFLGSSMDSVPGQTVYGMGVLLIGLVLIGTSIPTALTSWWLTDPDPEDLDDPTIPTPARPEKGRS